MSKKQPTPAEHEEKISKSIGKRVRWVSKTREGTGKIAEYYGGKRGNWVSVVTDSATVVVRPSQVTLF